MIKSQKGYSLLITIVCVVIISILGVGLITLTTNGMNKNESRDDLIQAETLATKGLDYLVSEINFKLEQVLEPLKESDDIETKFLEGFENIIDEYSCDKTAVKHDSSLNTNNKYEYCIVFKEVGGNKIYTPPASEFTNAEPEKWYTVNVDTKGTKKEIAFKSIGNTENATSKTLYTRKTVGLTITKTGTTGGGSGGGSGSGSGNGSNTGTVSTNLKYAISTFEGLPADNSTYLDNYPKKSTEKVKRNNKDTNVTIYKGENDNDRPKENGSVFLHGGVDVIGKMYIKNNLYVGLMGIPRYREYTYSSYPRIFNREFNNTEIAIDVTTPGKIGNFDLAKTTPGVIETGKTTSKIYYWTNTTQPYDATEHYLYLQKPSTTYIKYDDAVKNSNQYPILSKGIGTDSSKYVTSKFVGDINNNNPLASSVDFKTISDKILDVTGKTVTNSNTCTNPSSKTIFTLYCKGQTYTGTKNIKLSKATDDANADLSVKKGVAYYDGNLNLGSSNNSCTIEVQGTFFINGNLKIDNCTVKADAVFYINGVVDINGSTIHSMDLANNKKGTLIFFANKNIGLQAISGSDNSPSNMKAYFLSNNDIAITGSTSYVLINGGLSARSIELTAMRGSTSSNFKKSCSSYSNISNCQSIDDLYTIWNKEKSDATKKFNIEKQMRSRLTVVYNSDVIHTYEEHGVDEEKPVYGISPNPEIDRVIK